MHVRLVLAALIITAGCGGSDSASSPPGASNKTVDVYTIGNTYSPSYQTVSAGDTVRWNFAGGSDGLGHNVRFTPTVAGAPADINILMTGTASRVFTTKGDYQYVCDVHPGMIGEIVVQ